MFKKRKVFAADLCPDESLELKTALFPSTHCLLWFYFKEEEVEVDRIGLMKKDFWM